MLGTSTGMESLQSAGQKLVILTGLPLAPGSPRQRRVSLNVGFWSSNSEQLSENVKFLQ